MTPCACGRPADAGSHRDECRRCFKARITTIGLHYHPSASPESGARSPGVTETKRWFGDLERYRQAKAQGIQPATITRESVERAVAISDATGTAFRADAPGGSIGPHGS